MPCYHQTNNSQLTRSLFYHQQNPSPINHLNHHSLILAGPFSTSQTKTRASSNTQTTTSINSINQPIPILLPCHPHRNHHKPKSPTPITMNLQFQPNHRAQTFIIHQTTTDKHHNTHGNNPQPFAYNPCPTSSTTCKSKIPQNNFQKPNHSSTNTSPRGWSLNHL